jgi:hypothetical protein
MAQDENNLLNSLCERASREQDPSKLLELTKEINEILAKRHQPDGDSDGDKKIA